MLRNIERKTFECVDCHVTFDRKWKIIPRCQNCCKLRKKERTKQLALTRGTKFCDRSGCSSMKIIPLTQKFCSKSCSNYGSRWETEPVKFATCVVCGVSYGRIRPASHQKRTCGSNECLSKRKSQANKGKILSSETRQRISKSREGMKLSLEHRRNIGRGVAGHKNGLYIDGRSMVPDWEAYENFGRALKRDVKERDGFKCKVCGKTRRLVIHHIDNDKKNPSMENLITLCNSCHSLVHGVNEPRKGDTVLFEELRKKLNVPSIR